MSLYLGNLSVHTRREELERVFRRFGQCDVRLKDGYGFVVYGFAPQAEKALKVLQGRKVCGQLLNMTWSNKQPRPVPRNPRGRGFYEPRGRDFSRTKIPIDHRDNASRIDDHRDSDLVDGEGTDYHQKAMIDDAEPEIVDCGRWGERAENENGFDSDAMVDRYEPCHGYDRREKDESRRMEHSGGSALGSCSHDNVRRERDSNAVLGFRNGPKFRQHCFGCGELGHKARDCHNRHFSHRRFVNRTSGDRESERSRQRNENASKNRSKREARSPKRRAVKKSKKSASIPARPEYTASRSRSASKSSKSWERSRSRSQSSSPRSSAKLRSSKSVDSKSRSPVSNQPLDQGASFESKGVQVQHANSNENNSVPENPKFGSNENAISATKVEDNTGLDRRNSEAKPRSKPGSVTSLNSITLEEMCDALKHFGVAVSEESEKHTSLEGFFGSARLWPWEGIYYRRVKKGPISVENYSKRVAQNREFSIVDKYVRSSSGWGEMYHENP